MRRFAVSHAVQVGVQIADRGTVDLHQGEVSHNPVGANVQTVGFDLTRLADAVLYTDNGQNLDTSGLPIADPVVP